MNSFKALDIDYISSSRTIETVVVSNSKSSKVLYIYNYEGYSFRVFESILQMMSFFKGEIESKFHFNNEDELDSYLAKLRIN